jgi:ribosomal protein L7/L12
MIHVKITGWNVGFRKIECTKILQSAAGLGSTEAKQMTDAVLGGETRVIEMKSESEAKTLVTQLEQLGAVANVDGAL